MIKIEFAYAIWHALVNLRKAYAINIIERVNFRQVYAISIIERVDILSCCTSLSK